MLMHQLLHIGRIRNDDVDADPIAVAHSIDHVVGLLRKAPGVERDHTHSDSGTRSHVDEH